METMETRVTDKAAVGDEWVQDIRNKYAGKAKVVVGLDVVRKQPDGINVEPATLQLRIILQLFHMDQFPTTSLKSFFMDGLQVHYVGVEVEKDIIKISLEFWNWEDVRELANIRYGIIEERTGLKDVAMLICLMLLMKPTDNVGVRDWEATTLSSQQVEYACMGSYASYCVAHKLLIG